MQKRFFLGVLNEKFIFRHSKSSMDIICVVSWSQSQLSVGMVVVHTMLHGENHGLNHDPWFWF